MLQIIKSLPHIFYDKSFYANLVRRGAGIGLGYIVLQVFLSLLIPTFTMTGAIPLLAHSVESLFDRLPIATFQDNKLSIDQPSPYIVYFDETDHKKGSVVFDTSATDIDVAAVERKLQDQGIFAFVTRDFIAMRKGKAAEIHEFSQYDKALKNVTINHEMWHALGEKIINWTVPVVAVFMIIFTFIGDLFVVFIGGAVIKLVASFLKMQPDFAAAMRLSAVAAMPGTLIAFVLALSGAFGGHHPHAALPFLVNLLIWAGFAGYGLFAAGNKAPAS